MDFTGSGLSAEDLYIIIGSILGSVQIQKLVTFDRGNQRMVTVAFENVAKPFKLVRLREYANRKVHAANILGFKDGTGIMLASDRWPLKVASGAVFGMDVIFLDQNTRVIGVSTVTPDEEKITKHPAAKNVVLLNEGTAKEHGIAIGQLCFVTAL